MLSFGWRRAAILLLAGAFAGISMAPLFLFPALFVAFPILVWCLDGTESLPGRQPILGPSFAIGFWFGLGYFTVTLHWVGAAFFVDGGWLLVAMPLAVVALAAFLALFWAVAIRLAFLLWSQSPLRILMLAASLGLLEFARAHLFTGLPFNLVGIALTPNAQMMQIVSVIGLYALTTLTIALASTPALIWPTDDRSLTSRVTPFFIAVLLLGGQLVFGQMRLDMIQLSERTDMRVRVVQPVIDQATKWRPEAAQYIEDQLVNLSAAQLAPDQPGLEGVTHLIWPEAALPFYLDQKPETFSRIAQLLPPGTTLLTGMPRRDFFTTGQTNAYNAILAIDSEGEIVGTYDKVHLVPIGEFLPFKSIWAALGITQFVPGSDGWTHGEPRRNLTPPLTPPALPLICYEAIFPREMGENAQNAEWIINVTNDGWFDGSIGPAQHFHHALLRTVETGLPMVRAANSGISAIIDPLGQITQKLEPGEVGVIDASLPHRVDSTIYTRVGNWPFFAPTILFALLALFGRRQNRIT